MDVKSPPKAKVNEKFDYGKTIQLWKNNSIMEKQFDFEKKNRFGNQISIFNFDNFYNFEKFFLL